MNKIDYEELKNVFKYASRDERDVVVLGSDSLKAKKSWIINAENKLDIKFSDSYLWFLDNYFYAEIVGDELFTVWDPIKKHPGLPDIVFHTISDRNNGFLEESEVALMRTSLGEDFIWRTDEVDEDGEFPVYLQLGEHREYYAPNYIAFLIKYIKSCLEQD